MPLIFCPDGLTGILSNPDGDLLRAFRRGIIVFDSRSLYTIFRSVQAIEGGVK